MHKNTKNGLLCTFLAVQKSAQKSEKSIFVHFYVAAKVAALRCKDGLSVKTALVYDGHLAPGVEADGYFDAIVPFRQLMGL